MLVVVMYHKRLATAFKGNAAQKKSMKEQFEKKLKKPGARQHWKENELLPWENKKRKAAADFNSGAEKRMRVVSADADTWEVTLNDEQGRKYEQLQPYFWPKELWAKWHKGELHPDALETLEFKGVTYEGAWQDHDGISPLPSGVFAVSNFEFGIL